MILSGQDDNTPAKLIILFSHRQKKTETLIYERIKTNEILLILRARISAVKTSAVSVVSKLLWSDLELNRQY